MVQAIVFYWFFCCGVVVASSADNNYLIPVKNGVMKTDLKGVEQYLSLKRKKYFENQNRLEENIQAVVKDEKLVVVGLDKVSDHIDEQIKLASSVQTSNFWALDRYCRAQTFHFPEHVDSIVVSLKKTVRQKFDEDIRSSLYDVNKKIEQNKAQQQNALVLKDQKQKELLRVTALQTIPFFIAAIKAYQKKLDMIVQISGVCWISFLLSQRRYFYTTSHEFTKINNELLEEEQSYLSQQEELKNAKKLAPFLVTELDAYRRAQVDLIDESLKIYRSKEAERIKAEEVARFLESENSIRMALGLERDLYILQTSKKYQKSKKIVHQSKNISEQPIVQIPAIDTKPNKSFLEKLFEYMPF